MLENHSEKTINRVSHWFWFVCTRITHKNQNFDCFQCNIYELKFIKISIMIPNKLGIPKGISKNYGKNKDNILIKYNKKWNLKIVVFDVSNKPTNVLDEINCWIYCFHSNAHIEKWLLNKHLNAINRVENLH